MSIEVIEAHCGPEGAWEHDWKIVTQRVVAGDRLKVMVVCLRCEQWDEIVATRLDRA